MTNPPGPESKRISRAALVGLILGIVGLCAFPFALVGAVLGIVGLVKIKNNSRLRGNGVAIVAIALLPLVLGINGILLAIAIPNFAKYQARSKQAECRANLKAAYTAERAYFSDHNAYSTKPWLIEFSPERGNRYAYVFAPGGPLSDRSGARESNLEDAAGIGVDTARFANRAVRASEIPSTLDGLELGASATQVTIACAGRIGGKALDVWSISTAERRDAEGEVIPPGTPHQDIDGLR